MSISQSVVEYLRENDLLLSTAESCTAGKIVTLRAEVAHSGELIESGYVVNSPEAKQRLLTVLLPHFHQRALAGEQGQGALDER